MATRSNIIIRGGQFKCYLYRHYDGYPAETGAHLLETMNAARLLGQNNNRPDDRAVSLVNRLLRSTADDPGYDGKPSYHYEITDEIHGDIEHLYIVRMANPFGIQILHAQIGIGIGDDRDEAAIIAESVPYTPAEFADMVNRERADITARMRARGYKGEVLPIALA